MLSGSDACFQQYTLLILVLREVFNQIVISEFEFNILRTINKNFHILKNLANFR